MAHVQKRSNGKYLVRWQEYTNGPEKSRQFARKAEAVAFRDIIAGSLQKGDYVDPTHGRKVTYSELASGWMAIQRWRSSTRQGQETIHRIHIEPVFGGRPIGTLRPSELQAWVNDLTCAPSTAGRIVQQLKAVLEVAVLDQLLTRNPARSIRPPKVAPSLAVPLTLQQVQATAAHIRPDLKAAVVLGATTGLRQGELFGLTLDRVEFLRREIVVDRQLITPNKGAPMFGPPKSDRSVRRVPVADHALEALARHVDEFGVGGAEQFLFHRLNVPLSRASAYQSLRTAMRRAALEVEGGWHLLRHHAASVLIGQGLSVTAVAATLGHSPDVCLRTYAAWWPDENDQIRSAMSAAWTSQTDHGRTGAGS